MKNHDHKTDKIQLLALLSLFGMISSCDNTKTETDASKKNQNPQTTQNLQIDTKAKLSNSESSVNKVEKFTLSVPLLRENIGIELPQIKLHPDVQRSRDEISSELSALFNDKAKTSNYILKKWSEMTSSLPRTPLKSSTIASVRDGETLPPECLDVLRNSGGYNELILAGKYPAFSEPVEIIAAAGIQTLGIGLGNMMPTLLLKHSNNLPPTEYDIAIFAAIVTSISDSPPNMTLSREWQTLAKSENPIYRLLAITAVGQGSWGENRTEGILGFTTLYEKEMDPQILGSLAQILSTVPDLEARQRLELLNSNSATSNNDLLKEDIDQALRAHELLLSGK